MTSNYRVWLVDDLAKNRHQFEINHASDFDVEKFAKPSDVLSRIVRGEYPDALLIDVFFYDTEEQAEKAEEEVAAIANKLRKAPQNWVYLITNTPRGLPSWKIYMTISKNDRLIFRCMPIRRRGHFCFSKKIGKKYQTMAPRFS
jgi:hypothetical protein